jgi:site-specific DNA-methyltransferase (adenine-specific)
MLTDGKLAEIHDFPETEMVFPGVNIRGGVSYFVWKQDHSGDSLVVNYRKDGSRDSTTRPLLEKNVEVFIRHNQAVSILNKVLAKSEETFDNRVLSRNPFGIEANFSQYSLEKNEIQSILLFRSRRGSTKDKEVYISESQIKTNRPYKDRLKVLVSKASPGGDEFPHAIFSSPFLSPANSVSTETYLLVDFVKTKVQGENLIEYMQTKFFRFLVSLIKNTQNISKGSFAFVPVQDLGKKWTDEILYEKYGIDKAEQAFIDTMIRPMSAEEARDDA